MITCQFEDGGKGYLRHVTVDNIVLDKNEKKILLVRRGPHFSHPHKLAMPGGYLNRDETIQAAAQREVLEETGYLIELSEIFCIVDNPHRKGEDRQNITFINLAKVLKKVGEYDHEIEEIEWYDLDKIPSEKEFAFDHYETIQKYLKYRKKSFSLPFLKSN